jgi:hypothetical protein
VCIAGEEYVLLGVATLIELFAAGTDVDFFAFEKESFEVTTGAAEATLLSLLAEVLSLEND